MPTKCAHSVVAKIKVSGLPMDAAVAHMDVLRCIETFLLHTCFEGKTPYTGTLGVVAADAGGGHPLCVRKSQTQQASILPR